MRGAFRTALADRLDAVAIDQRERGNARRAVRVHRLALRVATRPVAARIANNLGVACKAAGRLEEAAAAYTRARDGLADLRQSDAALIVGLLHNLAGLEHARQRPDLAEPLARQGLALRACLVGTDHPDYAADLSALAAIVGAQGRRAEAEPMYRRALATFAARGEAGAGDIAVTRRNLARLLQACSGRDRAPETGARSQREQLAARAT